MRVLIWQVEMKFHRPKRKRQINLISKLIATHLFNDLKFNSVIQGYLVRTKTYELPRHRKKAGIISSYE